MKRVEAGAGRPRIIVVSGPTAAGKSALGLAIAKALGGEIINADSVQVYRHFDIGSAKPVPDDLSAVVHHLVSILEPVEDFNAGAFCDLGGRAVFDVSSRGKTPVIVGGTGLYIRALLCGISAAPEISPERHAELEQEIAALFDLGLERREIAQRLHLELQAADLETAGTLCQIDLARIRRALLVARAGFSLAALNRQHRNSDRRFDALIFALFPERSVLYRAIDRRVDQMLEIGLIEEVRSLLSIYPSDAKAFQSIGYRHAADFLAGRIDEPRLRFELKRDTRRFAKRQITWWRHQPALLGWAEAEHVWTDFVNGRSSVMLSCSDRTSNSLERAVELARGYIRAEGEFTREGVHVLKIDAPLG